MLVGATFSPLNGSVIGPMVGLYVAMFGVYGIDFASKVMYASLLGKNYSFFFADFEWRPVYVEFFICSTFCVGGADGNVWP